MAVSKVFSFSSSSSSLFRRLLVQIASGAHPASYVGGIGDTTSPRLPQRLTMSGVTPPIPLQAIQTTRAWTGKTSALVYTKRQFLTQLKDSTVSVDLRHVFSCVWELLCHIQETFDSHPDHGQNITLCRIFIPFVTNYTRNQDYFTHSCKTLFFTRHIRTDVTRYGDGTLTNLNSCSHLI